MLLETNSYKCSHPIGGIDVAKTKEGDMLLGSNSALALYNKKITPQSIRDKYNGVHCSAVYGDTELETVWVSISGEVGRQDVAEACHAPVKRQKARYIHNNIQI